MLERGPADCGTGRAVNKFGNPNLLGTIMPEKAIQKSALPIETIASKIHLIRSQNEEQKSLRSQIVTLKKGQHSKYLSFAFTEQGVAMLSSVLNSDRAIQVNIQIMRAFS